ncbi:MAG: DUF6502 family protein [Candidatus Thiodiazotropha sp.]|jgi:hypothetical protein
MKADRKSQIKKAVLRLLIPIVRLLIRNEFSHSEFSEIAKEAYVHVAHNYFSIPNRKSTYARVAVLTGLSRKEVVRLSHNEKHPSRLPKYTVNRAARVITGWLKDDEFLDKENQPKILPLKKFNDSEEGASFALLVERYSGDISPGAILDELIRLKIVSVIDKKLIRLDKFGFIPEADDAESIDILSNCASNLLNTGVFNITKSTDQESRFQRQLTHFDIPQSIAHEFKHFSAEKSIELLLELNDWLVQKKRSARQDSDETIGRIGIGIYYFKDTNNEKHSDEGLA